MGSKGSGINPGVEKNMSKKVLLIAGVLLAAGSIAAISAPHFRGGQLRLGQLLADLRDDDSGSRPARSGKRHRELDAEDEGQIEREDVLRSRRGRIARRDHTDDAEDMPPRARERMGGQRIVRETAGLMGASLATTSARVERSSACPAAASGSSPASTATATASLMPRNSRYGPPSVQLEQRRVS